MIEISFFQGPKKILVLRLKETGGESEVIFGDDDWFDYQFKPYSGALAKKVSREEDREQWALAIADSYKQANSTISAKVKTIDNTELPPQPEGTINFSKGRGVEGSKTLSSWSRRVLSLIIDTGIVWLLTGALAALLLPLIVATDSTSFSINDIGESGYDFGALALKILLASLVALLAGTIYYCVTMARPGSHNGQTLGKQILSITVVREDGKRVGLWFSFLRQILVIGLLFGKIGGAPLLWIPWAINYLWPLWDPGNQALHDKIVHSRVIRTDI